MEPPPPPDAEPSAGSLQVLRLLIQGLLVDGVLSSQEQRAIFVRGEAAGVPRDRIAHELELALEAQGILVSAEIDRPAIRPEAVLGLPPGSEPAALEQAWQTRSAIARRLRDPRRSAHELERLDRAWLALGLGGPIRPPPPPGIPSPSAPVVEEIPATPEIVPEPPQVDPLQGEPELVPLPAETVPPEPTILAEAEQPEEIEVAPVEEAPTPVRAEPPEPVPDTPLSPTPRPPLTTALRAALLFALLLLIGALLYAVVH